MRIIFVRHGETLNNALLSLPKEEYQKVRDADSLLSEKGVTQVNYK